MGTSRTDIMNHHEIMTIEKAKELLDKSVKFIGKEVEIISLCAKDNKFNSNSYRIVNHRANSGNGSRSNFVSIGLHHSMRPKAAKQTKS